MIENEFEYCGAHDVFYDFCLWDYRPAQPFENKLRSSNLLFHSFMAMGIDKRAFSIVRAIRQGFGVSRTVYGIKRLGDRIFWEFYFYDYRRRERERSITRLLDFIAPFVRCGIKPNENHFYFMFSIDVTDDLVCGARDLEEIHMYIGNPGSSVSSGICYSVKKEAVRLENFYFFFDAKKELDEIMSKVVCSAYVDSTEMDIQRILWPEMADCKVIVVANKQGNDAVYFSGIGVDQLILFLKRMDYPKDLIAFVEENKDKLDHLQFDVGYDYRMEGRDLVILKSGYYGLF
ncbi:MAG: hypothetical protein JXL20_00410 [Deltaproteobacteria bacterium]|nr:hypothetical protein [Deltaproteobacteria bacterium]